MRKRILKEVHQRLEKGKPDMIILDILLPKMNKMETMGHIIGKERIPYEGGGYGNVCLYPEIY